MRGVAVLLGVALSLFGCGPSPPALTLAAPVEGAHGAPAPAAAGPVAARPAFHSAAYPWLAQPAPNHGTIAERFACPPGYVRSSDSNGYAAWLRGLPLKPPGARVHLHDGRAKAADVAAAVVDIDTGARDLQQCADAVMRLRAEYLYGAGRHAELVFAFTSGHPCRWEDYRAGVRPRIEGARVTFVRSAAADASRASFRRWLDLVFTYAGTRSLAKELVRREPVGAVEPGDVLIQGGSPGHAVLVVDVCRDSAGGALALLAQSYMPAQDVHLLRNVGDPELGAWFRIGPGPLPTPEWSFDARDLRRWAKP